MYTLKLTLKWLTTCSLFYMSLLQATDSAKCPNENHPLFSTANWGALIIDANTHETVFAHRSVNLFIPASVTKLFTTISTLETVGPSQTFETVVKVTALPDDQGRAPGNLYIVGGADPLLESKDLIELAKRVHEAGVRVISGHVIVDDSLLGGTTLPIHGEWEDLPTYYSAEQNALSVNRNVVQLSIDSNAPIGSVAKIEIEEDVPFFQLINNTVIVSETEKTAYTLFRGFSNNTIEISGRIAASEHPKTDTVAIHNPQDYAKAVFIKALMNLGITVEDNIYSVDNPSIEIGRFTSAPLMAHVKNINKISDNLAADLIYKYINVKSGDIRPLDKLMSALSFKKGEYAIFDGSGLSRHNLITPRQTVALLEFVQNSPYFELFFDTLPTGTEYGTLERRFLNLSPGTKINAKTGSMSGISTLAGYATKNERKFIFAVFINNSLYSDTETATALDNFLLEAIGN